MKTYSFTLTEDMLRVINMGLSEVATKFGAPMIEELNRQIEAQRAPAPPAAVPPEEDKKEPAAA